MGAFAVLAMLAGLMMSTFSSDDEPDRPDEQDTPDTPDSVNSSDDPDLWLDTGASFVETEDGVDIELGEDESRSLAAIYYRDPVANATGGYDAAYEVRFYLVPEGTEWLDPTYFTESPVTEQYNIPGASEDPGEYLLEDFEAVFDLELLGVVDLLGELTIGEGGQYVQKNDRLGDVTSNAPVSTYSLQAATDGVHLITFESKDYEYAPFDFLRQPVSEDTIGTEADDWFAAEADGLQLGGSGGDDTLDAGEYADVTLIGGDGNDLISSAGDGTVVEAGDGDDRVVAAGDSTSVDLGAGDDYAKLTGTGTVLGGDGDDFIAGGVEGLVHLFGDAGDDTVKALGNGSEAHGGSGDDKITVYKGAFGYGGLGDDEFYLLPGATAHGGAGDDYLFARPYTPDQIATTISGGEGEDTIAIRGSRIAVEGAETDHVAVVVTDFDTDDDVLLIRRDFSTQSAVVQDVEILEAADGSHTDVRVTYEPLDNGTLFNADIIRLVGTTGVTADHIVIEA